MDHLDETLARYRRQTAFSPIGRAGQVRLAGATAAIIGCGALGTSQANLLVRAGVGRLVVADRDFVDLSNLQRQSLFDEGDVQAHLPKAVAAAQRLRRINSQIQVQPVVTDVTWQNIQSLIGEADVVLDGTDNFETRFLINDACCELGKPWVYGGCLGAEGQSMTILPGQTACFACLMPEGPPQAGSLPTCDSGGVLATIIQMIAAVQVGEALKVLTGNSDQVSRSLTVIDAWNLRFRSMDLKKLAAAGCPVCRGSRYDWLAGKHATETHVLCGRNSVQLRMALAEPWNLEALEQQLRGQGSVLRNAFLLRFARDGFSLTLFPDGRVIATGTEDPVQAKTWLAQAIGM